MFRIIASDNLKKLLQSEYQRGLQTNATIYNEPVNVETLTVEKDATIVLNANLTCNTLHLPIVEVKDKAAYIQKLVSWLRLKRRKQMLKEGR